MIVESLPGDLSYWDHRLFSGVVVRDQLPVTGQTGTPSTPGPRGSPTDWPQDEAGWSRKGSPGSAGALPLPYRSHHAVPHGRQEHDHPGGLVAQALAQVLGLYGELELSWSPGFGDLWPVARRACEARTWRLCRCAARVPRRRGRAGTGVEHCAPNTLIRLLPAARVASRGPHLLVEVAAAPEQSGRPSPRPGHVRGAASCRRARRCRSARLTHL